MPNDHKTRVEKAKEILAAATKFPRGCSEFVCEVSGVSFEQAKSLMGDDPELIGTTPSDYKALTPGDVAGWSNKSPEHVAIYIGEEENKMVFIDVREPNPDSTPRKVMSYGPNNKVHKSSRY